MFSILLGMIDNKPEKEQGMRIVHDLIKDLRNGYNITTDNFFTSLKLAMEMLKTKKTLTGTVRSSRKEVPKILVKDKSRELYSNIFIHTPEVTMVSYVPKKRKAVILLSTQYLRKFIYNCFNNVIFTYIFTYFYYKFTGPKLSSKEDNYKPEMILRYNKCKGAVDTLDKMVKEYSCNRGTRRWPLVLFQNILDNAGINAYILYLIKFPYYENNKGNRRKSFLQELGLALVKPLIELRGQNMQCLHKSVQNAILMSLEDLAITKFVELEKNKPVKGRCILSTDQRL